jgi:hypothetical protein
MGNSAQLDQIAGCGCPILARSSELGWETTRSPTPRHPPRPPPPPGCLPVPYSLVPSPPPCREFPPNLLS